MSALLPLAIALDVAITTDAQLGTILAGDKLYSGVATPGSPFPYITYGSPTEVNDDAFGNPGYEGTETLHIWSREIGERQVREIYGHLSRILNRTTLVVEGHAMVMGETSLVTILQDPDGVTSHGIVRYRVLTEEA